MTDNSINARITGGGFREVPNSQYAFFEILLEGEQQDHGYNRKRITWSRGVSSEKSVGSIFKTLDKLGADPDKLNTIEDCEAFLTSIIGRQVNAANIEEKSRGGKTYLECGYVISMDDAGIAPRYGAKASADINARFAAAKQSVLASKQIDLFDGGEEPPF